MANRVPLVQNAGVTQQLQSADTLASTGGVAYQLKDEKDANSGYLGLTSNGSIDRATPAAALNTAARNGFRGGTAIDHILRSAIIYGTSAQLWALDHADDLDSEVLVDCTVNNATITLPPVNRCRANQVGAGTLWLRTMQYRIFRIDTNTAKLCTIDGNGTETINGALTITLGVGESVVLQVKPDTAGGFPSGDWYIASNPAGALVSSTEVTFSTVTNEGRFTVTDLRVTATSKIMVSQSGVAATGKTADENEMDALVAVAIPGTGSFALYVRALDEGKPLLGSFKFNYTVSN